MFVNPRRQAPFPHPAGSWRLCVIEAARIQRSVCSVSEMTRALTFRDVPEEAGATPCDVGALSARRQFQGCMERTVKVPVPKQCCASGHYLRKRSSVWSNRGPTSRSKRTETSRVCKPSNGRGPPMGAQHARVVCHHTGGASSDGVHCSRHVETQQYLQREFAEPLFPEHDAARIAVGVLRMSFQVFGEGAVACRIPKAGRKLMSPHVHAIPVVNVAEPRVVIHRVQRGAVGCRQRRWYDTEGSDPRCQWARSSVVTSGGCPCDAAVPACVGTRIVHLGRCRQ